MEIRLNIGYFKSFQGIVKIVQLVRINIHKCLCLQLAIFLINAFDYWKIVQQEKIFK